MAVDYEDGCLLATLLFKPELNFFLIFATGFCNDCSKNTCVFFRKRQSNNEPFWENFLPYTSVHYFRTLQSCIVTEARFAWYLVESVNWKYFLWLTAFNAYCLKLSDWCSCDVMDLLMKHHIRVSTFAQGQVWLVFVVFFRSSGEWWNNLLWYATSTLQIFGYQPLMITFSAHSVVYNLHARNAGRQNHSSQDVLSCVCAWNVIRISLFWEARKLYIYIYI
jgi:hypothetical protein